MNGEDRLMFGKILQCFKPTETPKPHEIIMMPLFTEQEIEDLSAFEWVKHASTSDFIWYACHKSDKSIYAIVKFNGIYELYTTDEKTCELVMRNRYIDLESSQLAASRLYKNDLLRLNRMFGN